MTPTESDTHFTAKYRSFPILSVVFEDEIINWHMLINIYRYIITNKKKLNHYNPFITNFLIIGLKKESLKFRTIHNIIEALELYPDVIKFLDVDFTTNMQIMLDVVSKNGSMLVYASTDLKSDKDFVIAACANYGFALNHAALILKSDKDVVITAIRQNGLALKYASMELRSDSQVVWLAVKQNGNAFQYASKQLKFMKKLILLAIKNKCKRQLITHRINEYCIENVYSNYIKPILNNYKNCIYTFMKHIYGVKYFIIGSNHENPILKSNLLKLHLHGIHHAKKFKQQILSYLGMINKSIHRLLYDTDEMFLDSPFVIAFRRKKWYIIEGNIGSGKTELLNKLNELIDCEVIKEPVDVWQNISIDGKNILQLFYENPSRYAYLFQTIVFKTRLQSIDKKQVKKYRFTERSIWTDKYVFGKSCIESNKMNQVETTAYYQWFDWLEKKFFRKPDGIIYLYCTPDKCYQRVNIRSRCEETSICINYLKMIHDYHEEWINNWTKTEVLIIDNTIDNDWINIIQQIKHFIQ